MDSRRGTRNIGVFFTYRGGAVVAQLQLGAPGADASVSAVFENFPITPVPEPTALAVISAIAGLVPPAVPSTDCSMNWIIPLA